MAKAIDTLSIKLEFKDAGTQQIINKLSSSLKGMTRSITGNTSPAISKLRNEILSVGKASTQSISNFRSQRNALAALRDEARVGSATFKRLTDDIKKLDAQMGKTTSTTGRRGGARQTTQIAGAVVSGGIFGGPEGAIGALSGAALGGVEGAFAGAAIGAQLKGLRDLTASAANYAADIEKLQIALRGVSGSQADYNSAIEAAQDATSRFNVPQRDAIAGVTRLAAAVKGAGGPIEDAETTFKNITAAIKATGGSTEDVRGAITAMVQVFSKGKVSAEELSGQLGERLPGAVTKFAEANDMTLPELQKNLKAGTVGLNELMNFIVALGDEYTGTAEKISSSNAEAGARLTVVIQDLQANLGRELVPIGAQFQAAFAEFIKNITPALVEFVPKIAQGFLVLAKNLDTLLVAATAAFAVFAPAKLVAIIANVGGISGAVTVLKTKLVAVGLANPFTALAIGAGALAGVIFNAAKEQARFNDLLKEGSVVQVNEELRKLEKQRDEAIKKLLAAKQKAGDSDDFSLVSGFEAEQQAVDRLNTQLAELRKRRDQITDTDPTQGAALDSYNFKRFKYDPVTPDGSGTADAIKDITKEQADAQIQSLQNRTRGITLTKEAIAEEARLARVAAQRLPEQKKRVELAKIEQKEASQLHTLEQQQLRTAKAVATAKLDFNKLMAEANGAQGLLTDKQLQQELNQIKVNELMLKYKVLVDNSVISTEELKKKLEEAVAALNQEDSPLKTFKDGVRAIFEEATNLNQALAERGVQAVDDFGNAFADFVATGKANFRELTASILRDLSRIFAKKALFSLLGMIPGVGTFLGLAAKDGAVIGAPAPDPLAQPGVMLAAKGGAFAKNKIVPYAKGGIVKKPTFFQYASGGYGNFGLMGEAGPEAIMPLRRGRNGRLGVESSGGGTTNVNVNVDASGSSVQGNSAQASQLGKAIGAAVQTEILRQKRPGGLLAGA